MQSDASKSVETSCHARVSIFLPLFLCPSQHQEMQNHELYGIVHVKRAMALRMKGRGEGYPGFIIIIAEKKKKARNIRVGPVERPYFI